MAEGRGRQGHSHTVVLTVRIRHALSKDDALGAALSGSGEFVCVNVAEDVDDIPYPAVKKPLTSRERGHRLFLPF